MATHVKPEVDVLHSRQGFLPCIGANFLCMTKAFRPHFWLTCVAQKRLYLSSQFIMLAPKQLPTA